MPAISTTVKLRVIGRQQQLLRIDFETTPSHEVLRAKLLEFAARLGDCDAVILSDYGKGGLAHIGEMIRWRATAGKQVLVDPKGDDFSKYAGATIVTRTAPSCARWLVAGRTTDGLARKAEALRSDLGLEALLVTRSEEGMSLFHAGGAMHEQAVAREVFDVSGAGDTVIATLAVMLAAGRPGKTRARGERCRRPGGRQIRHGGGQSRRACCGTEVR
jgi:rfaE bifunctional protein kinase chain/domain